MSDHFSHCFPGIEKTPFLLVHINWLSVSDTAEQKIKHLQMLLLQQTSCSLSQIIAYKQAGSEGREQNPFHKLPGSGLGALTSLFSFTALAHRN